MEKFDFLVFFCKSLVILIYGGIATISAIFTFSIETYLRIDGILSLEFWTQKIMNPLEANINVVDDWLISHNTTIGPVLMFLSIVDISLLFRVIDTLGILGV